MALLRVEYAALAAVAGQIQPLSQRLVAAGENVRSARLSSVLVGDPVAAADYDELLRQWVWFIEIEAESTDALARALGAASGDYSAAENIVVR